MPPKITRSESRSIDESKNAPAADEMPCWRATTPSIRSKKPAQHEQEPRDEAVTASEREPGEQRHPGAGQRERVGRDPQRAHEREQPVDDLIEILAEPLLDHGGSAAA